MKQLYALFTFLLIITTLHAQVKLSADGPGDTYELIESKGFGVESPDCRHTSFGRHVTEIFDNTLGKNVFVFHSHPVEDDDRCGADDRVRMEIKGGNGSSDEMQHTQGQTAYYRWKFKLDANFIPSSRFTHIFQIKAIDGDAGAPLMTITPRAGNPQKMQIIHSAGEGSGSLGTVHQVDLAPFKGTWVEAYVKYKSSEGSAGTFEITIKRVSDGATLLSYTNNSLDMWRTGASYNRGKWGVYRGKDAVLRDEQVRFADFCISESSASLCPSDIGSEPPPICQPVVASGDDGNVAANVLDNNLSTRWSATGDGQWIQFCLSSPASITGVQIAFYSGNTRTSTFDVLVGDDGINWTTASAGRVSSGTSLNLETFSFSAITGKYVRIVGHGNSVNAWNSYTEVKIQTGSGSGQTITLAPQHDAYVRNGTAAGTTHGTTDANILVTKLNSTASAGNDRHTYLRFDAGSAGSTITSAVLRLYGKIDDDRSTNVPINVYGVSNTTWTESTITWNNKPATGASALQTATVTDATARYYSWDITAYVQSELAAGRTLISLALLSTVATDPRITWNSKETGSNGPQLVITTSTTLQSQRQLLVAKAEEEASELRLSSFPNPFRGSNTVVVNLAKEGYTQLAAYDMTGRQVAVLVNARLAAGAHRIPFRPEALPAGIYLLRLSNNGQTITQKLVKE
ncbi:T9SS C-terminal target domain-containing protein [Paraflavitalea soli]|uniref:T9SS C-terminal target domain-containing protein n=1 Tax=Paraflavitalea soli TaxID=2315862 RepID=A0A3B7MJK1_9BACT|nr:DNRLRE domain-containing protein [Paraflavitalea soli]AXY73419.1 T9SS C-terminal target domain-containing protein [Paraflavitalea soli]